MGLRTAVGAAAAAAVVAAPLALGATGSSPAPAVSSGAAIGVDTDCFAPQQRIDPQVRGGVPTNPAWLARDAMNQYCASLRVRDQLQNPAFGYDNLTEGGADYVAQFEQQVSDGLPQHVHGGFTTLIPGSDAADPFRDTGVWSKETGGRVLPVTFRATDGAILRGHVFLPPKRLGVPRGGYPGVVITDGSVQAYQQLYYWAAEGLAQYGYEVLTYDVQGQGESDLLPAGCTPSSCPGVPYQQDYNFYQGAEDSLSFFDSRANPGYSLLDTHEIGIAGHSLGASAVSWVGQCDTRVRTIVAWDDLDPVNVSQCAANVTVPKAFRATRLHTPALATTNDYEFNVQPATAVPDPHGGTNAGGLDGDKGYQQLAKAGINSELVSFRNGTHLTYTYIPLVLDSNELSERFAFYYTLAWFDEYLRGGADPYTAQSAYSRLTSYGKYDASADRNSAGRVSIGAGTYDPAAALAHPTDRLAGNVPYTIAGISIPDSLSFYYYSEYHLTNPRTHATATCLDLVAHCPRVAPPTP